jgi:hypothetical protein
MHPAARNRPMGDEEDGWRAAHRATFAREPEADAPRAGIQAMVLRVPAGPPPAWKWQPHAMKACQTWRLAAATAGRKKNQVATTASTPTEIARATSAGMNVPPRVVVDVAHLTSRRPAPISRAREIAAATTVSTLSSTPPES